MLKSEAIHCSSEIDLDPINACLRIYNLNNENEYLNSSTANPVFDMEIYSLSVLKLLLGYDDMHSFKFACLSSNYFSFRMSN